MACGGLTFPGGDRLYPDLQADTVTKWDAENKRLVAQ